ncbi:MAG: D-aminoacylase [Candidatus Hydrogenedentota bacterium]
MKQLHVSLIGLLILCTSQAFAANYDLLIRNGTLIDGSGGEPVQGDIAVNGDRIAAIGNLSSDNADTEIDATGLVVSPGFINMLSHATTSLIVDPRGMSDIKQGVTLEVFGEASMGPISPERKANALAAQGDYKYDMPWNTLGEYLDHLETRGIAPNVASFVGASTVRMNVIGFEDRAPTPEELDTMKDQVRVAMQEGAMGVTSALIYAPAFYAKTDELVELCKVASEFGGMYIVHMRSEANRIMEAIDETITIAREANLPAEIYHLKMAGKDNWGKLDAVIEKVEAAQKGGLRITANMYNYTAGATGLDASMPPWVQEGGYTEWARRLKDPEIRKRVKKEMNNPTDEWENLYYGAGSPDKLILIGFKNPDLKKYTGRTLAEVARERGTDPADTAMDLVIEDGSRVTTVYFLMSEENVKRQVAIPWVSFGSDAGAPASEGDFLKSSQHPRAYGNFARLLGKYVREEKVITLQEAVRKLAHLPATNLGITDRGLLKKGNYADIVVFDPKTVGDKATFDNPHQYSVGMHHVIVNGVPVLKDGEHTNATPGKIVRGAGWVKR